MKAWNGAADDAVHAGFDPRGRRRPSIKAAAAASPVVPSTSDVLALLAVIHAPEAPKGWGGRVSSR